MAHNLKKNYLCKTLRRHGVLQKSMRGHYSSKSLSSLLWGNTFFFNLSLKVNISQCGWGNGFGERMTFYCKGDSLRMCLPRMLVGKRPFFPTVNVLTSDRESDPEMAFASSSGDLCVARWKHSTSLWFRLSMCQRGPRIILYFSAQCVLTRNYSGTFGRKRIENPGE